MLLYPKETLSFYNPPRKYSMVPQMRVVGVGRGVTCIE